MTINNYVLHPVPSRKARCAATYTRLLVLQGTLLYAETDLHPRAQADYTVSKLSFYAAEKRSLHDPRYLL